MSVLHKFVSAKADGLGANEWQPSHWNAAHNAPPIVITMVGHPEALDSWVVPAAETELNASSTQRIRYSTTYATRARIAVYAEANTVGASFRAQYSLNGSTWVYLDGVSGPTVALANTTDVKVSAWATLAAGAKADNVFLRIVGINGDGVTAINFGMITLQFD